MTTTTMPMLETYPAEINLDRAKLAATIDALIACSEACTACADACLGEGNVADLTQCIRLNLDCADICIVTGSVGTRRTGSNEEVIARQLEACAFACRACGDECRKHAKHHEHCRICADACQACLDACRKATQLLGKQH